MTEFAPNAGKRRLCPGEVDAANERPLPMSAGLGPSRVRPRPTARIPSGQPPRRDACGTQDKRAGFLSFPIIDDSNPIFRCIGGRRRRAGSRVSGKFAGARRLSEPAGEARDSLPPGGPLDIVGRAIAQKLTDAWGQSVVVDNRPGAGGNIGADIVAKSAPDGYTILMGALSTHAVNPSLYAKMPYDAVTDFAPITLVAVTPNVLVVNASLPVNSAKEFIAYAKANSGKLAFGSGSNGSAGHLAGELFKVDTGARHRSRSLQGRRAGHAGVARRRYAVHVRQSGERDAAGESGQAESARRHDGATLEARTRAPDDGGGRIAGFRHLDVVRPVRSRRHARPTSSRNGTPRSRRSSIRRRCARSSSRRAPSRRPRHRSSSPRS